MAALGDDDAKRKYAQKILLELCKESLPTQEEIEKVAETARQKRHGDKQLALSQSALLHSTPLALSRSFSSSANIDTTNSLEPLASLTS